MSIEVYYVVGFKPESGEIVCFGQRSSRADYAIYDASIGNEDVEFLGALPPNCEELVDFQFSGESVVSAETILDQDDVFGKDPGEAPKRYTVLGFNESTGKIFCDYVDATSLSHAFTESAKGKEDIASTMYISAHEGEIGRNVEFAGESMVSGRTYIAENTDNCSFGM